MVKDRQVRRLWELLAQGKNLSVASASANMTERTARKYRKGGKLPSEAAAEHSWRTRPDPFADVWPEVYEQLQREPGLQAKTLFGWLQQRYPGRFADGQLRTFQRGIKAWRATCGPAKEVFFSQVHVPGRLGASDFTHMTSLGVTIGGQPFDHMLYHFVLTYSNWESVTLCFSESFESLSEGLQNALGELGGVPARHRSDRLSAAVNNLSDRREFTVRYEALLAHYGLERETINARQAHENGDVEQSHRRLKEWLDQMLMLRGSRDFADREQYVRYLQELIAGRNANRQPRLAEELKVLRALPQQRYDGCRRIDVTVDSGSLIHVQRNVYSVNSRLIGERVQVRIYAEHLEVWYGQKPVERLPRLRGRGKHCINYRHIIDWLVRKPGALENYRYQADLFPTSRFRMAYDALTESMGTRAGGQYVRILHLAARESEAAVDDALRLLLAQERPVTFEAVENCVRRNQPAPAATDVFVEMTDLASFDALLLEDLFAEAAPVAWGGGDLGTGEHFTDKEVCDGEGCGREDDADGLLAGVASADVPGDLRTAGSAGRAGDALV